MHNYLSRSESPGQKQTLSIASGSQKASRPGALELQVQPRNQERSWIAYKECHQRPKSKQTP